MNLHSMKMEKKSILQSFKEIMFTYFEVSIKSLEMPFILVVVLLIIEFYSLFYYQFTATAIALPIYNLFNFKNIFFYSRLFNPYCKEYLITMIVILSIIILSFILGLFFAGLNKNCKNIKGIFQITIVTSFYISICSEKLLGSILIHSMLYLKGVVPFLESDSSITMQGIGNELNIGIGITFFILLILSGIIWIIHLIFTKDARIFNSTPLCFQENYFHLMKFVLKIIIGILNYFDTSFSSMPIWTIIIILIILAIQVLRFGKPAYRHFFLYYFNIAGEILTLLGFVVAIINRNTSLSITFDFSIYLFSIILPFCVWQLETYYKVNLVMQDFKSLNENQIILVMRVIISLIPQINRNENFGLFSSIVYNHSNYCELPNCLSHSLINKLFQKGNGPVLGEETIKIPKEPIQYSLLESERQLPIHLKSEFKRTEIHLFVTSLFLEIYSKFPKTPDLYILHSNYEYYLTNHLLYSLQQISNANKVKPSILNQFDIFLIKAEIQSKIEFANKISSREIPNYINCSKMLEMNKKYTFIIEIAEKCTENVAKFWQNLSGENISSNDLMKIGKNLYNLYEKFEKETEKVLEKQKINVNLVYRIAMFKRIVMHRERDAEVLFKYMFKYYDLLNNSHIYTGKLKKNFTGKALLMKVSGEKDHIGEVLDVSIDAEKVLLYKKNEIMGRNINNFLPPVISKFHSLYIENFISTMTPRILSKDFPIFIKSGQGYFQKAIKYVKFMTSILNGINFCVIIYIVPFQISIKGKKIKLTKEPSVLLAESDGKIFGINASCEKMFGVSASFINQNPLSIYNIFPELTQETEGNFISDEGCILHVKKGQLGDNLIQEYNETSLEKESDSSFQDLWIKIEKSEWGNPLISKQMIIVLSIIKAEEIISLTSNTAIGILSSNQPLENLDNAFTFTDQKGKEKSDDQTNVSNHQRDLKLGEAKSEMPILKYVQSISKLNYIILVSLATLIIFMLIISIISMYKVTNTNSQLKILKHLSHQNEALIYSNNIAFALRWIPSYLGKIQNTSMQFNSNDTLWKIQQQNMDIFLEHYSALQNLQNGFPENFKALQYQEVSFQVKSSTTNIKHKTKNTLNTALVLYFDSIIKLSSIDPSSNEYTNLLEFISDCIYDVFLGTLEYNFEVLENDNTSSLLEAKSALLALIISGIGLILITTSITILKSFSVIKQKSKMLSIFAFLNPNEIKKILFQVQNFDSKSINIRKKVMNFPEKLYEEYRLETSGMAKTEIKIKDSTSAKNNDLINPNPSDSIAELIDPNIPDTTNIEVEANYSNKLQQENIEFARYQSKIRVLSKLNASLLFRVAWKVILGSFLIMGCFGLDIYLVTQYFNMFYLITNFFEALVTRRWYLNAEYLLLFNALTNSDQITRLSQPATTNYSFDYYYNGSLSIEDTILNLENEQSSSLSNFFAFTKSIDSSSFCDIVSSYSTTQFQDLMCKTQMGNFHANGMRNIIFRILQINIQMKLNIISGSVTEKNFLDNKDFINAWELEIYGINPLLNAGFELFMNDINYNLNISQISQGIILGGTIVVIVITYFLIFNLELSNLQKEIIICKDLLMLIPAEIASENPQINKFFVTGDYKFDDSRISRRTKNEIN